MVSAGSRRSPGSRPGLPGSFSTPATKQCAVPNTIAMEGFFYGQIAVNVDDQDSLAGIVVRFRMVEPIEQTASGRGEIRQFK